MKAGVSLSCFHTLFITRSAIHLQMISQIQSPDFRNPGWEMSHDYIYMRVQDYLKFRAPRYVISPIDFHAVSPWLRVTCAAELEDGCTYVRMYMRAQPGHAHWRQKALCPAVGAAALVCSSDLATLALEKVLTVSFYLKLSLLTAFCCSV